MSEEPKFGARIPEGVSREEYFGNYSSSQDGYVDPDSRSGGHANATSQSAEYETNSFSAQYSPNYSPSPGYTPGYSGVRPPMMPSKIPGYVGPTITIIIGLIIIFLGPIVVVGMGAGAYGQYIENISVYPDEFTGDNSASFHVKKAGSYSILNLSSDARCTVTNQSDGSVVDVEQEIIHATEYFSIPAPGKYEVACESDEGDVLPVALMGPSDGHYITPVPGASELISYAVIAMVVSGVGIVIVIVSIVWYVIRSKTRKLIFTQYMIQH